MKMLIFLMLLIGVMLLFAENHFTEKVGETLRKTGREMSDAARRRALEERRRLRAMQEKSNFFTWLERELYYSGLKFRFPGLTAEAFVAGNLVMLALIVVMVSAVGGIGPVSAAIVLAGTAEYLCLSQLKVRNLKTVNENLMKLLDFLGNYSITSGEVAGILFQVSRYMEFPIKPVLEACYYEVQTTGDTGAALVRMAEKVEHPKFKELACNMEVSLRYCADLSSLVSGSRRSLLEYMRNSRERKGMLREALISMALLLGMSFIILTAVGYLVQMSPLRLLTGTLPGRIGLGVLLVIGVLFAGQLRKVHY